jgi:hypothetical protein
VAQPLDVIKTRLQRRDFQDKTTGVSILGDMVKKEGFGAFFKGLVPKLVRVDTCSIQHHDIGLVVQVMIVNIWWRYVLRRALRNNQLRGFHPLRSCVSLRNQAVVGPKLVFSFTVAQQLMSLFESRL